MRSGKVWLGASGSPYGIDTAFRSITGGELQGSGKLPAGSSNGQALESVSDDARFKGFVPDFQLWTEAHWSTVKLMPPADPAKNVSQPKSPLARDANWLKIDLLGGSPEIKRKQS